MTSFRFVSVHRVNHDEVAAEVVVGRHLTVTEIHLVDDRIVIVVVALREGMENQWIRELVKTLSILCTVGLGFRIWFGMVWLKWFINLSMLNIPRIPYIRT